MFEKVRTSFTSAKECLVRIWQVHKVDLQRTRPAGGTEPARAGVTPLCAGAAAAGRQSLSGGGRGGVRRSVFRGDRRVTVTVTV